MAQLFDLISGEELAAEIGHRSLGPNDTITYEEFGQELGHRASEPLGFGFDIPLWERLKGEFRQLVCGKSNKYQEFESKIAEAAAESAAAAIAVVAGAIASHLGTAASTLSPMVALLMLAVVKRGRVALCSGDRMNWPISLDVSDKVNPSNAFEQRD